MKIKLTYTSKDEIPSGLETFYEERDGAWHLPVEGVKTQGDVDRAMAAMDKQKNLRIEAEKELAKYRDIDLDKWEKVKDLDPDKKYDGLDPKDEKEIQKRISEAVRDKEKEMQAQYRKREDELLAEKTGLEDKFKRTHLEQWRRNVLAEKFGFTNLDNLDTFILKIEHSDLPDFVEINRIMKSIEVSDDNGRFKVVGGELKDEKGALEVLESVAKREVAKNFRPAANNQGGGAGNRGEGAGTGNNPYKKETWNVTEQGRLERESPEDARRMAGAAGVTI